MSYTIPARDSIFFVTTGSYIPPERDSIDFISGTYRDIAQWSTYYIGTDISLSTNSKIAWRTSTGYSTVLSNIGVFHLSTYTELSPDDTEDINAFIGLAQSGSLDLDSYLGDSGISVGFGKGGNYFASGGLTVNSGVPHTAGDRIGFAVNPTTGKVWVSVNGAYINSGNPTAGTNATIEGFNVATNGPIYIGASPHLSGSETVNSYTLVDYSGDMLYSAPDGFSVGIDGYNAATVPGPHAYPTGSGDIDNPDFAPVHGPAVQPMGSGGGYGAVQGAIATALGYGGSFGTVTGPTVLPFGTNVFTGADVMGPAVVPSGSGDTVFTFSVVEGPFAYPGGYGGSYGVCAASAPVPYGLARNEIHGDGVLEAPFAYPTGSGSINNIGSGYVVGPAVKPYGSGNIGTVANGSLYAPKARPSGSGTCSLLGGNTASLVAQAGIPSGYDLPSSTETIVQYIRGQIR